MKRRKQFSEGEIACSRADARAVGHPEVKTEPQLKLYTLKQISSKCITDLNLICKSINF